MRALVSRKLTALGYSIGPRLKFIGVELTCLNDPKGLAMLLVSNVFYGPSWPQIHKALEHLVPAPTLMTHGNTPAVLIADSTTNRELIAKLFNVANASRVRQVHLEGVGFVELEANPKLDPKQLVLPLVSIVLVIGLGIFWGTTSKPAPGVEVSPASAACIVDLNRNEFESWLRETLRSEKRLDPGQEIQIVTAMGKLNIAVESTIGSAAKVSGVAICQDGRERLINHRVDTSGSGAVLDLGQ